MSTFPERFLNSLVHFVPEAQSDLASVGFKCINPSSQFSIVTSMHIVFPLKKCMYEIDVPCRLPKHRCLAITYSARR
jgi:hypothetical protein